MSLIFELSISQIRIPIFLALYLSFLIIFLYIYPLLFYGFPSFSHLLNFPDFPGLHEHTLLDTLFKEQPRNSAILACVFPSLSNNKIRILSLIFPLSSSFNAFWSFSSCSELRWFFAGITARTLLNNTFHYTLFKCRTAYPGTGVLHFHLLSLAITRLTAFVSSSCQHLEPGTEMPTVSQTGLANRRRYLISRVLRASWIVASGSRSRNGSPTLIVSFSRENLYSIRNIRSRHYQPLSS